MLKNAIRSAGRRAFQPTTSSGGGPVPVQNDGALTWITPYGVAGKAVDAKSAMRLTAFQRGVRIRAVTSAMLPLHVYDRRPDGTRVESRSPLDAYLWDRPNPEMRRIDFWSCVYGHRVSTGNAYMYVETEMGLPKYLWPIEPRRVKPGRASSGAKVYSIDGGKIAQTDFLNGGNIVHVMGFSTDGITGISPIQGEALGLAMAAEEYAARTFSVGSPPGGVLSTDQSLTRTQADEINARWERHHAGVENSHKVAVLDRNLKYQAISINPGDAQLLETRKFQVTEIARMLGVPPHLIGDVEKSTSWGTGIEEQTMGFLTFTLMEDIIAFEQACSDDLLAGTTRYVKWETKGLLRTNATARADYFTKMIATGVMNQDEARDEEDLPPIADGSGAVYYMPLTLGVSGTAGVMSEKERYDAAASLIRSGFAPDASLAALGLPPTTHLGLLPVTVQRPVDPASGAQIDPETGKDVPGTGDKTADGGDNTSDGTPPDPAEPKA